MHKIKYMRYPNSEIRVTHYYSAPRREVNPVIENDEGNFSCPETASAPEVKCVADSPPSLDISSKVLQSAEKMPHRRTKFGLPAKRTLLRLGGAYDTVDSTPENYIFLTGTIPGGTHDAFMAVAKQSSYITQAIALWLKRTCPSKYWFYVWELQRRGALHIHYCIHAPDSAISDKILHEWRTKWESILETVGDKTGTDMWLRKDGTYHKKGHSVLQAYAQKVRKSVAAYLSGYCGGSKDKHSADARSPYYPGRWWGCSRESTKLLRGLTEQVVVEHTNYRSARYEMLLHYERVLHDSPKAHHYPHKVGIGSTVVSYHPEDKGTSIWLTLNPMLYKTPSHLNTVSTIQLYRTLTRDTTLFLEASPLHVLNFYRPLLTTLRGLVFPKPVYGYSIARKDIQVIKEIPCDLSSPLCTVRGWEKLRLHWITLQDSVKEVTPKLQYDRHGYVCNSEDILKLLDSHWALKYLSTTEPKGADAVRGGANGSISPQPPLPGNQLCLFSDL